MEGKLPLLIWCQSLRCKPAWTCPRSLFPSHHELTLWCSSAVSVHPLSAKPLAAGLFWAVYLLAAAVALDTLLFILVDQSGLVRCKGPIWLAWQTVRLVHSLAVASAWVHAHWYHIAQSVLSICSGLGAVSLLASAPQHMLACWLQCKIPVAACEHSLVSIMCSRLLLSARRSSTTFNILHQSTKPACIWLAVMYVRPANPADEAVLICCQ